MHLGIVCVLITVVSLIYATAGQAGGTAFLAVMSFMAFPARSMRPTALTLNVVAAGYATWRMHSTRVVDWKLFRPIILASVPAAFLGGLYVLREGVYFAVVGTVLLAAAVLMVTKRKGGAEIHAPSVVVVVLVGLSTGLLSGLTGVGGGVFLAPLLIALHWTTPRGAAGLSAPFIFVNSVFGLAGVLIAGQSVPPMTAVYSLCALAGAAGGTWIGLRYMSEKSTRWVLAGILVFAGTRLLLR